MKRPLKQVFTQENYFNFMGVTLNTLKINNYNETKLIDIIFYEIDLCFL